MTDAALGAFALFALLAVVAPFVLYALVRAEGRNRETMARDDAERVARRDTDPRGHDTPDGTSDTPWSTGPRGDRQDRRDDGDG